MSPARRAKWRRAAYVRGARFRLGAADAIADAVRRCSIRDRPSSCRSTSIATFPADGEDPLLDVLLIRRPSSFSIMRPRASSLCCCSSHGPRRNTGRITRSPLNAVPRSVGLRITGRAQLLHLAELHDAGRMREKMPQRHCVAAHVELGQPLRDFVVDAELPGVA